MPRAIRADFADVAPRRPYPQRLTYASGTIRPNHRSQAEQDDAVRAAYDRWKGNYLVAAGSDGGGNPLYRVAFGKPGTDNHTITVSEGQGYGMVIVAHLAGHEPDARAIFDGLWRFSRTNPSIIDKRLMGWHLPVIDPQGNDSAFDGDCDIAYASLLADAQWGSAGAIDYRAAAGEVLAGMLASTVGPRSHLPMLGDWVKADGEEYNEYTPRSSDFMPGHFRAFGRASGEPAWQAMVDACRRVVAQLQTDDSPTTGLLPDFIQPVSVADGTFRPADPDFLEGKHDGHYSYNAGRDPWRLGTDALLTGDAMSFAQAGKIAVWAADAAGGNPANVRAGYTLDGTPLPDSDYFTTFFVAPLGVAAMTVASQQQWLNDIYEAVYDRSEEYYEDSVTLLCLLVMTGNFWDPTGA